MHKRAFKILVPIIGVLLLVSVPILSPPANAANESVSIWITSADRSRLLQQQSNLNFGADTGSASYTIDVNEATIYQTMDGFGASITDSSAGLMYQLSSTARNNLMTALFSPTSGIGISFLRQPIGSSDYIDEPAHWTFDDRPAGQTDYSMTYFSIAHDQAQVIPLLQQARQLNPSLKVMLSPWSPPAWMKDNGSLIGGHIKTDSATLNAYALYLVKSIQAYEAAGIPIYAISVQNEPQNRTPNSYPGTNMPVAHQAAVINALGPALANAGLSRVKIIAFDHNWSLHPDDAADAAAMGENPEPDYPLNILASSANQYIAGTGWHMYSGDASRQTTVHNAYPNKDIWFTEGSGWHGSADAYSKYFSDTMDWHMRYIFVASIRNWAKSVVNWNMALNPTGGPGLGGCVLDATRATNPGYCQGVVTINGTTVTYNAEYYDIGHFSKFVKVGAVRIDSSTSTGAMETAAFKNPDGTKALVVYNVNGGASSIKVRWNSQAFIYNVPAKSIATFTWGTSVAPTTPPATTPPPSGNLALNRPVTCSSIEGSGTPCASAVDGNTGTRWASAFSDPQWIYVDLGAAYTINRVVLNWEAAYGRSYQIQVSASASGPWTNIYSTTTGDGGTDDLAVAGSGRYVRMYGTARATSWGYSLWEFQVYGSGGTPPPTTPPPTTPPPTTPPPTTPPPTGTFYRITSRESGKSLDVAGGSTADGAAVQQWTYGGGANQQFEFRPISGTSYFQIVARHSGKCVDVSGVSTADGANIDQWTCYAANQNQHFRWQLVIGSYYRIVARHSGKCLDVRDHSLADGARIQQWTCQSANLNQQWTRTLVP